MTHTLPLTAIVLGGGGARGAYEAGVVAGITQALGGKYEGPLFDIICGTSVGAINAAYLAACAEQHDHGIAGLEAHWTELDLKRHLKIDLAGMLGVRSFFNDRTPRGRSLLAIEALEELVFEGTPWEQLRKNISSGRVRALVVTALAISSGKTAIFADLAPGVEFPVSRDPRRTGHSEPITGDHVLASAAIPLIFPPRRIRRTFYADGGLRFNTPLAPALRLGAERIVVIPLMSETPAEPPPRRRIGPLFLAGKLLNAVLLDPISYDLQVLQRFNRIVNILNDTLTPDEQDRFDTAMREERGAPYRAVQTLVFQPTQDIGRMARVRACELAGGGPTERAVAKLAEMEDVWEADLLSFILFDGEHARRLIELGKHDVRRRADEVRAFFTGT